MRHTVEGKMVLTP